ncbi:hypothetical protein TNCV_2655191 [Trichonephila clavipes]|nr:hypothetical protein TNCV_2655191 [Trichonephila clavipes]
MCCRFKFDKPFYTTCAYSSGEAVLKLEYYKTGKGFAGAFKLCSTLNLPRLTKTAYKNQEAKLLKVVQEVAEESIIKAATEIVEKQ